MEEAGFGYCLDVRGNGKERVEDEPQVIGLSNRNDGVVYGCGEYKEAG